MADATNNTELESEFLPYVKVYKNGHVERLMGAESSPAGTDPQTGVVSKDVKDIIPETEVYVRIYLPKLSSTNQKLPIVVYFHGGAFILFTPSTAHYHNYLNVLAAETQVIAVSVHYRRAPEHPLPIAYEDSWAAFQWVVSHSNGDGPEVTLNQHADFQHLFLYGDSAGANIVHNLAIAAGKVEAGLNVGILGIVLVDPYFGGTDVIGSEGDDPDGKAFAKRLWPWVCPSCPSCDDPWINPVAEGGASLARLGCSRVQIFVAEKDVLKSRGKLYFEVLGKSGWMGIVGIHEAEGQSHVFHLFDLDGEKAKERMRKMAAFFNRDALPPMLG
ncbi:Arylacetamide deacetylase [Handroanthus impetiginosus]|uniref:Arylacetamide deacetylase n=1 Tax=Handroanthus impetiginosus TaxID=429701 RepID=A0A2G9H5L7_9LAMI|nr:Arylacetamide deacetylase [Handroanthus impetiginosus]